jgi:hypothetical protein
LRHAPPPTRSEWAARLLGLTDRAALEAAVETALIAGVPAAWSLCRDLAAAQIRGSDRLLVLVAMLGSTGDQNIVTAVLADKARQRQALWALGFGGRRAGADACIDMMRQVRHTRLAAEAFSAITGLDLSRPGWRQRPRGLLSTSPLFPTTTTFRSGARPPWTPQTRVDLPAAQP